MNSTLEGLRDGSPWPVLLADGFLILVAVAVPYFAPVAGVGLIAAGVAGRRLAVNEPTSRYLYNLSIAVGVALLAMVVLALLLVVPAHASGSGPVITPVAVPTT